jgi:hypothetical protein
VLAWTNPFNDSITVAAIQGTGYGMSERLKSFQVSAMRLSDYVSITRDFEGRAVLTWMSKQNDHLFYALVDGNAIS